MRPRIQPLLAAAALAALAAPPAAAQETTADTFRQVIHIVDVVEPRDKVAVALPDARVHTGARPDPVLSRKADELRAVLWDDLQYSGVFRMVPAERYARVRETTAEKVPYDDWVAVGARFLVLVDIESQAGDLVVEGRLFEVNLNRKVILGKRYSGPLEATRKLAHTFADAIIQQVGGEPGVCRTKIAFLSDRDSAKPPAPPRREVYVADYDGHGAQRMTATHTLNMSPEWSPDNDQLVYTSYLRGNPDLYIMPRSGGRNRLLFGRAGMNTSPAWSPDGERIAFASSAAGASSTGAVSTGGDSEIYTIRPDGSGLTRLTHNRGIDTNPAFSPSGREIAFTSDRTGRPQIWLMSADGLDVRRLTRQGPFNDGAAWAPRGANTRVAFAGMSAGQFHIFVHTVETGELVQLTFEGSNEAPAWSPDGRQIAFASTRGGTTDIYVMNDDGSNMRRITRGGNNFSPAWSH